MGLKTKHAKGPQCRVDQVDGGRENAFGVPGAIKEREKKGADAVSPSSLAVIKLYP